MGMRSATITAEGTGMVRLRLRGEGGLLAAIFLPPGFGGEKC